VLQPHARKQGVILSAEDGNFVAATEDVLEIYRRSYEPVYTVICMDEQPIQLHAGVREPMPA